MRHSQLEEDDWKHGIWVHSVLLYHSPHGQGRINWHRAVLTHVHFEHHL